MTIQVFQHLKILIKFPISLLKVNILKGLLLNEILN